MSWLDNWKQKRMDEKGYKFRLARRREGKDMMGLSEVADGIYIGGCVDVINGNEIDKKNIIYIINVCRKETFSKSLAGYYWHPLNDNHGNTFEKFEAAVEELACNFHFGTGNVLVHCVSGINRSVSVVAAFLAVKNKLTFEEVLAQIKSVRPFANPTPENTALIKEYIERHK